MPTNLTFRTGNAVTITNAETSLAVNGGSTASAGVQTLTNKGIYQLFLSSTAMAKGDEYRWRIYEKTSTGAAQKLVLNGTVSDTQSESLLTPQLLLGIGWNMTLQRISATSRTWSWTIRQVST